MNPLKKSYNAFKKTCSPAQLYFVLGLIAILVSLKINVNVNSIIINSCLLLLWTYLLNVFCNWGWSGLSWFLVLFPYIILLLAIFLLPFCAHCSYAQTTCECYAQTTCECMGACTNSLLFLLLH